MANKQHRPTFTRHLLHLPKTLPLKFRIPHRQHLINHQYLRLQVGGHGEAEPYLHAGGVELHRGVNIFLHAGEVHDFIEFAVYFPAGHAEDGTVHVDIVPAGEFGVEAGAYLEQGTDAACDGYTPVGGFGDAGEDFEQGALPGAVVPDDAEHFALLHFEVDVPQCPEDGFVVFVEAGEGAQLAEVVERGTQGAAYLAEEGIPAFFFEADAVAFGEIFDFDDGGGHEWLMVNG